MSEISITPEQAEELANGGSIDNGVTITVKSVVDQFSEDIYEASAVVEDIVDSMEEHYTRTHKEDGPWVRVNVADGYRMSGELMDKLRQKGWEVAEVHSNGVSFRLQR